MSLSTTTLLPMTVIIAVSKVPKVVIVIVDQAKSSLSWSTKQRPKSSLSCRPSKVVIVHKDKVIAVKHVGEMEEDELGA